MSERPLDEVLTRNLGGFVPEDATKPPWQRETLDHVEVAVTDTSGFSTLPAATRTLVLVPSISDFRRDRRLRFRASGRLLAAPATACSGRSRASAPPGNEASCRSARRR